MTELFSPCDVSHASCLKPLEAACRQLEDHQARGDFHPGLFACWHPGAPEQLLGSRECKKKEKNQADEKKCPSSSAQDPGAAGAPRRGGISLVNRPCPCTAAYRRFGAGVTPHSPVPSALLEGTQADGPGARRGAAPRGRPQGWEPRLGTRFLGAWSGSGCPSLMFCGTLRDAEMEDAIDVQSPVVSRDNRRINRKAG